jgi:hypothetical protein
MSTKPLKFVVYLLPSRPLYKNLPGALSFGVKRSEHEANHLAPSSTEVKNEWYYASNPQYVFMAWCLVKRKEIFTNLPLQIKIHKKCAGLTKKEHGKITKNWAGIS